MSDQGLFLDEVLESRRAHWLGSVHLAAPISHRISTLAALFIAAAILVWLFAGHYTRRERVSGSLVPRAGLIELTTTGAGTVTYVIAHEGSHVNKGDVLVTISSATVSASIGNTAVAVISELNVERA